MSAQKVRFIDQLKVGAYALRTADGAYIEIANNINNYVLTATGQQDSLNGEANLTFNGANLGVGITTATARFEIQSNTTSSLMLIRNSSNQGIHIDQEGTFQLIKYDTLPTAQTGSLAYQGNDFWIGL